MYLSEFSSVLPFLIGFWLLKWLYGKAISAILDHSKKILDKYFVYGSLAGLDAGYFTATATYFKTF